MVEGGHHTWRRNNHEDQLVCLEVPPSSVYKGGEEERAGQGEEAHPRGAILLQQGKEEFYSRLGAPSSLAGCLPPCSFI